MLCGADPWLPMSKETIRTCSGEQQWLDNAVWMEYQGVLALQSALRQRKTLANFSLLFRQMTSLTTEDFPEAMQMSGVETSGRALCHLLFSWGTESHYGFWPLVLQPLSFRMPVLAWEGSQAPRFSFIAIIAMHFPHLTPQHSKWLQRKKTLFTAGLLHIYTPRCNGHSFFSSQIHNLKAPARSCFHGA